MTRETSPEAASATPFGAVARRLRSASMASLSAWDVTPSQMRAIRILTGHEAGVRSSELAHHLHIAPRSATEVVDALEAKGLVQRSPDPSDRRATLVSLTPRGRRAARRGTSRPRRWSRSGSSSGSAAPTATTWPGSCAGSSRSEPADARRPVSCPSAAVLTALLDLVACAMATFTLTCVGDDRPGLVSALSAPIGAHGASWERSQMARLAGKFAGVLLLEVPDDEAEALVADLTALEDIGLHVMIERTDEPPPSRRSG